MWGFSIFLMQLADYFHGRKSKMKCKLCGKSFENSNQIDFHVRTEHK